MAATPIEERSAVIGGLRIFLRRKPGSGTPTLFVHGNPTSSSDWLPFIERLPGPALAFDLPGFGRSERPRRSAFDCSLHGYADFVAAALEALEVDRYRLVVHDWGVLALATAQRHPERLERIVVINAVPLLAGYRWHWVARIWRRRGLGELFNATSTKPAVAALLRLARPGRKAMPAELVDEIWAAWDPAMSRAILALYRSADPPVLEAAGARLDTLRCPALVLWGRSDPYIGVDMARGYAAALADAELELVERAGHWPWIDRPELVDRVVDYLGD